MKNLTSSFALPTENKRGRVDKETLAAILQASEWFFEQIGDDLRTYANHAHRKTIDESDATTLMKRSDNLAKADTQAYLKQATCSQYYHHPVLLSSKIPTGRAPAGCKDGASKRISAIQQRREEFVSGRIREAWSHNEAATTLCLV